MRPGYCKSILAGLLIFSCCSALDSQAQIASGSDGGSGALTVAANTVKDLSLATTGSINDAGRVNGTYDPSQWAIVFEYTDVTVSAGTLSFLNHPSGAPVVWLVSGNVTITGTISLSGQDGTYNGGLAAGGPGGEDVLGSGAVDLGHGGLHLRVLVLGARRDGSFGCFHGGAHLGPDAGVARVLLLSLAISLLCGLVRCHGGVGSYRARSGLSSKQRARQGCRAPESRWEPSP